MVDKLTPYLPGVKCVRKKCDTLNYEGYNNSFIEEWQSRFLCNSFHQCAKWVYSGLVSKKLIFFYNFVCLGFMAYQPRQGYWMPNRFLYK